MAMPSPSLMYSSRSTARFVSHYSIPNLSSTYGGIPPVPLYLFEMKVSVLAKGHRERHTHNIHYPIDAVKFKEFFITFTKIKND